MNIIFHGLNAPPDPDAGVDQIYYDTTAQNIVNGKGFTYNGLPSTYTPGPTFALATIYQVFGISYAYARIGWSLLGALTVILVYFIGNHIQGEMFGLLASLALALHPIHSYYSSHFLSEVPFSLFISVAILSAILLQKHEQIRYAILLGVAAALGAYMKPAAILYLPLYVTLCFIYLFPLTVKRCAHVIIPPILAFIVCILPWTIRNYSVTGHIIPLTTHGGTTFLDGNNETAFTDPTVMGGFVGVGELPEERFVRRIPDPYERDKMAYRIGFNTIKRHIRDLPKVEAMKLYRAFTFIYNTENKMFNAVGGASWALLLPFFIAGLLSSLGDKLFMPLHAALGLVVIVTLIWFGDFRYRESIAPVLVIYGCRGLSSAVDWTKQTFQSFRLPSQEM